MFKNRTHLSIGLLSVLPLCAGMLFSAVTTVTAGQDAVQQAASALAAGDTTAALKALNSALKQDKHDGPARLARAGLYFARGQGKAALNDYHDATGLPEDSLRADAWLGMSRTQRLLLHSIYRAEVACRKGLSLAPDNTGLLMERAQVQLSYGGAEGHSQASEALVDLLCIDPAYPGAYRLWRDSCPDPDFGLQKKLRQAMEPWLAAHPDSAVWWQDLAWDSFLEGETEEASAILERLGAARPDFNSPDRELLAARCKVELGDSAAFMEHYSRALDLAVERDTDTRAFLETEVILTRQAAPRWADCTSNRDKCAFLRSYWLDLDDDPLEPLNRRLIEHYNRLNYAQRHFHLRNPSKLFNRSGNYNRLLTRQSTTYYYDSEPLQRQTAIMGLDPRGVVWVRMGPPEKLEKHYDAGEIGETLNTGEPESYQVPKARNPSNRKEGPGTAGFWAVSRQTQTNWRYRESAVIGLNSEYWYYGKATLLFVDYDLAGEYVFIPEQSQGPKLNMMTLVGSECFIDPRVNYTLEYYMAQFLAANTFDNEVEFYQDDWLPTGETPTADIAVYDSLWGFIGLTRGEVFRVKQEKDRDLWLARHRITVFPGKYHYTVRMCSGDEKWLGKGEMQFPPFEPDSLNLSAVVLGAPAATALESPERCGEKFVPRPSTRFGRGEEAKVYFEVYNLQPDSLGERNYTEWIDVVRLEEGESRVKKYTGKVFQLLTFNLSGPRTSITQSFERRADWRGDRAPEIFSLDTQGLESGAYRIVIQVRDNVSGQWDTEETFFDISADSAQATR